MMAEKIDTLTPTMMELLEKRDRSRLQPSPNPTGKQSHSDEVDPTSSMKSNQLGKSRTIEGRNRKLNIPREETQLE